MRKALFAKVAAFAFLAASGVASAQTATTTTTTWTDDQGNMIKQYSTTKHYNSVNDPNLNVTVGSALPSNVTLYPLPDTVKVPDSKQYSYVIVNGEPVVVETTTRKVVHTW